MQPLEEATILLENTGTELRATGEIRLAEAYLRKARELELRGRTIFGTILKTQALSTEQIKRGARSED
ncbi:hypothetical protein [Deinococcus hopiensis]|uniref:hypothetical protein n=1 Tax=Deinococcus hopiensis TaxID=309885 RepID=UPI00111C7558|nr:hypothetical protein [Deinococcus hopiensis]